MPCCGCSRCWRAPGTLLVISHDRDFLDAVTDHILHLQAAAGGCTPATIRRSSPARGPAGAAAVATHGAQQRRIRELQSFVDRFRAKASKARQAQARLKMIERIEQVAPVHQRIGVQLQPSRPPIACPHPCCAWTTWPSAMAPAAGARGRAPAAQPRRPHRAARPQRRRQVDAGQSCWLASCRRSAAKVLRDPGLKVGYFAQHQLDHLDIAASPLLHLQRLEPSMSEQAARDYLGGFCSAATGCSIRWRILRR
jgi:ATP-binding cassette, subfamily F, member 3